ncbi:MAG: 16S rRNA (adenine(1518)-N(6)/adenine(1519)-N(6))-dimethyltransferase RsmA [Acidiferrobacterales bacterium]
MNSKVNNPPAHRPRKRFGQHFLHDKFIIEKIVKVINPVHDDAMLEIGPGLGVLTTPLLSCLDELHVVELDRDLIEKLKTLFQGIDKLVIHSNDALVFDYCQIMARNKKIRIVGNLPYNISTPLIFHLLDQVNCIEDMTFMLQKEVVDRITAKPGGKDYGRLSVMIQLRCATKKLFDVPANAFSPPPKVISSVIYMKPYKKIPWNIKNLDDFAKIVRFSFAQRRKTIRNSLKSLSEDLSWLDKTEIDLSKRPETLSVETFSRLANAFTEKKIANNE